MENKYRFTIYQPISHNKSIFHTISWLKSTNGHADICRQSKENRKKKWIWAREMKRN